jgi:alpha-L-fucosidase 2
MPKTTRRELIVGAALTAMAAPAQERSAESPLTLWYRKPASKWESEALPIGNGSLGTMVFGQVEHERLQLNEHSLWSGHAEVLDGPETLEALPKVRQLLFEGKYSEAQEVASREMMLHPRATPASYQTLGDLLLDFTHGDQAEGYRRSLDLDTGIARVEYTIFGVKYTREVFALRAGGASGPQALVMRIAADKPGTLTFGVRLAREEPRLHTTAVVP